MMKGDLLVSLWMATSAALITQVDFDVLNLPGAKAQEKQRDRPTLKNKCRGDADTPTEAREVAFCLAEKLYGWEGEELVALNNLWTWESGFSYRADNPTSSAYGIPQGLVDLHDLPDEYLSDPVFQIKWGLRYIATRSQYGTPSAAWAWHQARCNSAAGCWY